MSSKYLISSIEDIPYDLNLFEGLVEWFVKFTSLNVIILNSGVVLMTSKYESKLDVIISNMARHGLLMTEYCIVTNDCMFQLCEKLGLHDYDTNHIILPNTMDGDLSEIRDLLRSIVTDAVAEKVSDIHIEVRKKYAMIKFRKDGDIYLYDEVSSEQASKLCFVAFNRESDDVKKHFNVTRPLDASMELQLPSGIVRLRLASVPAYPYPSFDVVLRILTVDTMIQTLNALGYNQRQTDHYHKLIYRKSGAIIVAGATGSGKTTTLSSLISLLPKTKKIYTIEDPVEKKLSNSTQVPTNFQSEDTSFSGLTRQILRMDPDCIVIGEVRDEDTAKMMARAAITGHLVITTLHANSAINIILRLLDLGLNFNTLLDPSFLLSLTYQTLVKKLCEECKCVNTNTEHLRFLGCQTYVKGNNDHCSSCRGSGYKGRLIAAEVIEMSKREFQYIKDNAWFAWQEDLSRRSEDLKTNVIKLVKEGFVDINEAESLVGTIGE